MIKNRYTWSQIENKLKDILAEKLSIDSQRVTMNASFIDDLGADSLDEVEILLAVEDEFNIDIPNELAEKMRPNLANAIRVYVKENPREALSMVDTKVFSFRLRPDGTIEVSLQFEDGSWTYADGKTLLPSMIYLVTLSKWGNILKQLEDLINDPKTKEEDLQKFFEEYPELIAGDEYDVVIPQATISREDEVSWRADFILAPINQTEFTKIIELKLPNVPLASKPRSGHISFSSKIWRAICQLKDYGCAFDSKDVRGKFKAKYGIDVYNPDLHLIAGRIWNFQWMDNIRALRKSTPSKIEDWDSVLKRLKRRYQ